MLIMIVVFLSQYTNDRSHETICYVSDTFSVTQFLCNKQFRLLSLSIILYPLYVLIQISTEVVNATMNYDNIDMYLYYVCLCVFNYVILLCYATPIS